MTILLVVGVIKPLTLCGICCQSQNNVYELLYKVSGAAENLFTKWTQNLKAAHYIQMTSLVAEPFYLLCIVKENRSFCCYTRGISSL